MIRPAQVFVLSNLHVNGMALFPFLLVKKKESMSNEVFVNHEMIHFRQQLELLILPFYIIYFLHYSFNLIKYRNHKQAYRNIVFEREAYDREKDLGYLKDRRWGGFTQYFM